MWEYRITTVSLTDTEAASVKEGASGYAEASTALNAAGAEKWELVTIAVHPTATVNGAPILLAFWKRAA